MWPQTSQRRRQNDDVDSPHGSIDGSTPRRTSDAQPDRSASPDPSTTSKPRLWAGATAAPSAMETALRSPNNLSHLAGQMSPAATDRVFPIRSVVSMDPNPTPSWRSESSGGGYFSPAAATRRQSLTNTSDRSLGNSLAAESRHGSGGTTNEGTANGSRKGSTCENPRADPRATQRAPPLLFNDIASSKAGSDAGTTQSSTRPRSAVRSTSMLSAAQDDPGSGYITARFKHVISDGGHAIITGRDGDTLQRCEDEPIHIPGAVQGFGLLIAFQEEAEGKLVVRIVSENSKRLIGYTPKQLFELESFTDILSEEQTDNLLDHVDFIRDEDADVTTNGPEVFTMSIRTPHRKVQKLWCAMHINDRNPNLIICEFELEDDPVYPLVPPHDQTPEPPEDTLQSEPTAQEYAESTEISSRPLRVLRSARKRKGEAAAMEVFNIMSQVQEQLASAPSLDKFLKILVGVVKELTGFHRVMVYQFDHTWNGRVVTELVDPRATKDLYKGLNFPASDIPKQARELYKVNKVRMLYDRDLQTARLVCRTVADLETPLDLTYSYLRAMSPIHLKYLANMAVRSSMSISINAFGELWGLIACHSYGSRGTRVSFPIRKMCRLVGETASRNIERLSYASRLQARKLINTVPSQNNPSGYIIASSEDLLTLFDADFGLLSIRDETKILGNLEQSQEALAMLEYLRMRKITNVMTSQDILLDFPDLRYAPGFNVIAGLLLVPLSSGGQDFIVFFRKGQMKEVKWAGNPYEKYVKEGTEGYLEPRKSFKTWSETVVGKCREWTEEEIETSAVLCLVYGKFIEVWRQKEAALQSSQLTRLLLANSAHEVRTPLNAIINYLEIALEGSLDQETRENLAKSHSASKSLIYVINDLLDLTKTEEGGDLNKEEAFELSATLHEATSAFAGDARRKQIAYEVTEHPGLPTSVIGDQRRIRQAISNITANAIQNTSQGGIKVEMYVASRDENRVEVGVSVTDTGVGMSSKKLDSLFRELEQVQSEAANILDASPAQDTAKIEDTPDREGRALGLGLALVARIVRNMNGQLRLKSEEGKGSRFVVQFPFELPESESQQQSIETPSLPGSSVPQADQVLTPPIPDQTGEVTLVERASSRRPSSERSAVSRKNSSDSFNSRRSLRSFTSGQTQASHSSVPSEADRLIDAISASPMDGPERAASTRSASGTMQRPRLEHRHSTSAATAGSSRQLSRPKSIEAVPVPKHMRDGLLNTPGQSFVQDQRTPIKAVRVPEELGAFSTPSSDKSSSPTHMLGKDNLKESPALATGPPTADHMRVLIAEDDPVNSRIIQKRLDKMGHETYLTTNGEECSSIHGEKTGYFDVILMDMQMPIVDGLTSTKMIRSFEKSHPTHMLSTRASLNGRIPIIAVSASLLEREHRTYINAGFDGWILKPISFPRLAEILTGIVDPDARRRNLYEKVDWEKGGWFQDAQPSVYAADTKPDTSQIPPSGPSEGLKIAAASDDPFVKEDQDSTQTIEQKRMAGEQENGVKQEQERGNGE
ncbi:hypothetical protein MBLNU459_g8481t1 [Dothideomycetes sp. NU459]